MLIANKTKVSLITITFFPLRGLLIFSWRSKWNESDGGRICFITDHRVPELKQTCTLLFKQTKVPCVHWFRLQATSPRLRVYIRESWTALISGQPLCRLFALVQPCPYRFSSEEGLQDSPWTRRTAQIKIRRRINLKLSRFGTIRCSNPKNSTRVQITIQVAINRVRGAE